MEIYIVSSALQVTFYKEYELNDKEKEDTGPDGDIEQRKMTMSK
jgi:hypothetical protein